MTPDGYPEEWELDTIKEWSDFSKQGILQLLDYLKQLWTYPDYFVLKGKRVLYLELHTGGWSGNEDIVCALQRNYCFWGMYWEKSVKGGHYYFKIKRPRKEK